MSETPTFISVLIGRQVAPDGGDRIGARHSVRAAKTLVEPGLDRRGVARLGRFRGRQAWERLTGWPTRFLTGYFLTLRARKAEAR